jgi:hypothetical protein
MPMPTAIWARIGARMMVTGRLSSTIPAIRMMIMQAARIG